VKKNQPNKLLKEGMPMKKIFVYFLSVSFLLMMSGFPSVVAEAKEIGRPIGEMVSTGEVKFESRDNVWKNVEPSHFPIFQGVKIKTEKGASIVTLASNSQIDLGQNTFLSFDQNDRLHLIQGIVNFRIPSTADLSFKVGELTIIKSQSLQASKNTMAVSPKSEETIGSIFLHPDGSITVKSIQGSLSAVNQNHVVLASLSSKDSVTIPSTTLKDSPKVTVAQAGETKGEGEVKNDKDYTWYYVAGGVVGAAALGVGIWALTKGGGGGDHFPICR
jgi:hypothetical protein